MLQKCLVKVYVFIVMYVCFRLSFKRGKKGNKYKKGVSKSKMYLQKCLVKVYVFIVMYACFRLSFKRGKKGNK